MNTPQPLLATLDPADAGAAAFCEALAEESPRLLAMATRLLGDPNEARDALQEAWLRAWTRRDQLQDSAALRGWLRQIVSRECLRALRWRSVRRWLPFGDAVPELPSRGPDLAAAYDARRVRAVVDALPPRQRLLWGLRFDEGWTLPEIAEVTGLQPSTIKTHLERALHTVRAALEPTHV